MRKEYHALKTIYYVEFPSLKYLVEWKSVVICILISDTGIDPQKTTLSDYILKSVLELINKDATDNNKYLVQYFQLFVMYVGFGVPEVNITFI